MASFSVPCPKISTVLGASAESVNREQRRSCIASFPRSDSRSNLAPLFLTQGFSRSQSDGFKLRVQLNEVAVEQVSNSASALEQKFAEELEEGDTEEVEDEDTVPDASPLSAFMTQVSGLVNLVDSNDIVELQLKQMDCEVLIRKKEALPQPPASAPALYSQPYPQQAIAFPQMPPSNVPASASPAPSTPAPVPALPPGKPKSSAPALKCPMPGTFYRSPAPGAPPFVKVGDKVTKGQVLCIVEAMKLMNEVESDRSGTVVDILMEDGKPVSMGLPLFIIEP